MEKALMTKMKVPLFKILLKQRNTKGNLNRNSHPRATFLKFNVYDVKYEDLEVVTPLFVCTVVAQGKIAPEEY